MIKDDMDKLKPGHPWPILNLNQGIIATRTYTYNTDIIGSPYQLKI